MFPVPPWHIGRIEKHDGQCIFCGDWDIGWTERMPEPVRIYVGSQPMQPLLPKQETHKLVPCVLSAALLAAESSLAEALAA